MAARISVEQHAKRPVVIVVSAMSKVTDSLINSMRKAEAGDEAGLEANLEMLSARHFDTCRELLPADRHETALAGLQSIISEFSRITQAA